MEANGISSRQRRQSSADRFLNVFSQSPPSSAGDELNEDDVFWIGEPEESCGALSSSSFTSTVPPGSRDHRSTSKAFGRAENFGILAALPEMERERSKRRSIFNHKNSAVKPGSPSALASPSTSRMIPVIPRPPPERTFSASLKYQSAPMNVPMMMRNDFDRREKGRLLEENEDLEEDDEDGEMLPPHEIVARQSSVKSPVLSSSVLEGAGRTLKGRDLRQVRNAVFRQTGFLD